jgi:hypothetical protein
MKISIEADTKGETIERKVFEKVTQCIVAGSLIRQEIAPGTFRECHLSRDPECVNDMIGVLQAAMESLRDFKTRKTDGSDSTG